MEFLSWLFFCLSPFALVCTGDGNGIIMCPIFIILGFIFKWAGNQISSPPTVTIKIEPQNFWEWHYKDRISSTLAKKDEINDELMAFKDEEARRWATTICGYHNAPVPSEPRQEQIARSNGVITEKMVKAETAKKDRIQIGKYFLLKELGEKYYGKQFGKTGRGERRCYPWVVIEKDITKIKISRSQCDGVDEWWVKYIYGKTIREMWETLSEEEKATATKWIKEYEEKMLKQVNEYIEGGHDFYGVHIDY